MSGRRKGTLVIFGVLFVLGAGVTVVLNKQIHPRDLNNNEASKNEAKQNVYTNNIPGYKLTYPAGWLVDSDDPTMVVFVSPMSSLVAGSPDYGNIIAIGSSYLSYPTTIENFFSFYSKNDNFKAVPYSVNGLAATNFIAVTDKYKGANFIALTKNGKVFIEFSYKGDDKYKSVYENLLSSFKFIDPIPAPSNSSHTYAYETIGGVQPNYFISDWVTYLNKEFNFSVIYPRLWERKVFADVTNRTMFSASFNPTNSSQRLHPPSFNLTIYSTKYTNINSYLNDQKYKIISRKDKFISGQKGLMLERELKKSAIPIPPEKLWLVEKGNFLYVFSEGFSESNDNLWEKILNSFQFLV